MPIPRPALLLGLLLALAPSGPAAAGHTVRYASDPEVAHPVTGEDEAPPAPFEGITVGEGYWEGSGGAGAEPSWTDRPPDPGPPEVVPHRVQDFLSAGIGVFNVPQRRGIDSYRLEYLSKVRVFRTGRVFGGLTFGSQGFGMVYTGFTWNFPLRGRLHFLPSTSFGFRDDGPTDRFSGTLQFRTALELSWEFDPRHRLGFAVQHISNAELDHPNLGVNSQYLTYSVALGR